MPENEWSTKAHVEAHCHDCGWECYAKNAHGAGARHARAHKHTVRVEKEKTYMYEHGTKAG